MERHTLANRGRGRAFLAVAALLLGGCPSVPVEPGAAPAEDAPTPREGRSTPLDRPVPFPVVGSARHQGTGLVFSARAAGWTIVDGTRYDREANDLSFGYRRLWSDNRAEVTIYVYPRRVDRATMTQHTAAEHLDEVLDTLFRHHDDVTEVGRAGGSASLRGIPVTFAAAEHEHRGSEGFFMRRVTRGTTVVAAPSWWIKTFVTTARDHRDEALASVEELLAALKLPPTGLPVTRETPSEPPGPDSR